VQEKSHNKVTSSKDSVYICIYILFYYTTLFGKCNLQKVCYNVSTTQKILDDMYISALKSMNGPTRILFCYTPTYNRNRLCFSGDFFFFFSFNSFRVS